MSQNITNVALIGATGNVGVPVLKALLESTKFKVTAIVRPGSAHKFPSVVQVKQADLSSHESMVAAFYGHEAVINATNIPEQDVHIGIIDAAQAAGVYRLIPADFGSDPAYVHSQEFPYFMRKKAALDHLKKTGQMPGKQLTWSVIANGPFLDWNLTNGFLGFDITKKKADIISGGDTKTYYTTLAMIGQAVASVLAHPDETADRVILINSVVKSQNELLVLAKEALGADGWTIAYEDNKEKYAWAMEEVKKGGFSLEAFMHMTRRTIADPAIAKGPEKYDNELLGLKSMSDEEVKAMMKRLVA